MTTEYEGPVETKTPQGYRPWSEGEAQRIAMEGGLGVLSETHWKVIYTLREHFVQYGALPPMRLACGLNLLAPECVEELFGGACKPWQVAGLPEPGSEGMVGL